MGVKPRSKEKWQQEWTESDIQEIIAIADTLKHEQPMDDDSLFMAAEGEYSRSTYCRRI
jgi:hypothetical protein